MALTKYPDGYPFTRKAIYAAGDYYSDWYDLKSDVHFIEGQDYTIKWEDKDSPFTLFSPHGGGIEKGVSELIKEIASSMTLNWYLFEAWLPNHNRTLHITTIHHNHPAILKLLSKSNNALGLHGAADKVEGEQIAYMGGLDIPFKQALWYYLEKFGIQCKEAPTGIRGDNPENLCNMTLRGMGGQIEFTASLRKAFFPGGDWSRVERFDPTWRTETFFNTTKALKMAMSEFNRLPI